MPNTVEKIPSTFFDKKHLLNTLEINAFASMESEKGRIHHTNESHCKKLNCLLFG